jgi:hypothetical protein
MNTSNSQVDVDRVISNILKKYNLEKVPDSSREQESNPTHPEHRRYESKEGTLGFSSSLGYSKEENVRSMKSPNINFLSPLLSSGKFDSKYASLMGSGYVFKDDDLRSIPFTTPDRNEKGSNTGNIQFDEIREDSKEIHDTIQDH